MQLLRGEPGSGKTARIFQEFREAMESGRTGVRLLVPTATLVRHYQHELARDGVVFPPARILTLTRFASECAPEIQVIPEGLRYAIVRDVLRRGITNEFGEVASTEGLAATVIETISLFENAALTPSTVKTKRAQPLGQAFFQVWAAIDEEIHNRGFSTRLDLFREAAARIPALALDTIWMDGFLTFSQLEKQLLLALDQKIALTLTLPLGPEADDARNFAFASGARDKIMPGARPKPAVETFQPSSPAREADEICRRIIELNQAGFEFREIGVALRDNAFYLPVIRAAFARFGIPARFYFASSFAAHPTAVVLKGLLETALKGWDFEQALNVFRAHPKWRGNAGFDRFDFKLREAMPGRGLDALQAFIKTHFEDESNRLRKTLLHCLQIDSWTRLHLTPLQWQSKFEELSTLLDDRSAPPDFGDFANIEAARSYAAATHVWNSTTGQAAAFWPPSEGPVTLEAFWSVASECLAGASLRISDDRRNVVHIMSAFEARQWEVRALFVCGMSDRDYPRRHPENLLFPDGEIKRLQLPLRTARERDNEEERLFPSLIQRARQMLMLSAPTRDSAGRTAVPSRFLEPYAGLDTSWRLVRPQLRTIQEVAGTLEQINSTPLLRQLFTLHERVSPTGLESLAQCHFQFFANRALRLKKAPDRPADRFNFLVAGNILHETLRDWIARKSPDIIGLYEQAFDEAVRKERIPSGYKLEVERFKKRQIIAALDLTEYWNADSVLVEHEIQIPIMPGIELKGRVDRIDILGEECIIVDYKSGNANNVRKMVDDGTKLQGPLYALAVQENLKLQPVAMMYWALNGNKRYGWGETPGSKIELLEMPPDWTSSAIERVREKLSVYLSGAIAPVPADVAACRYCDFRNACRKEAEEAKPLTLGATL